MLEECPFEWEKDAAEVRVNDTTIGSPSNMKNVRRIALSVCFKWSACWIMAKTEFLTITPTLSSVWTGVPRCQSKHTTVCNPVNVFKVRLSKSVCRYPVETTKPWHRHQILRGGSAMQRGGGYDTLLSNEWPFRTTGNTLHICHIAPTSSFEEYRGSQGYRNKYIKILRLVGILRFMMEFKNWNKDL